MGGKDIEITTRDGSTRTHSCLLKNMSEPLKRMLECGMVESNAKRIHMPDLTADQLRFILRLAYTGHVQPSEWKPSLEAQCEMPLGAHTAIEILRVTVTNGFVSN